MSETLLIIGAGVEAYEGIRIAKSMGLRLIIADGDNNAPGFEFADRKIVASTYDGDTILGQAKLLQNEGEHIDGVIAMCADVPQSVATVTDALGLPGISTRAAYLVADKLAMKDALSEANIPIPNYTAINADDDAEKLVDKLGLPLVIKPVDSRGARGVQLIESESEIYEAIKIAEANSPTQRAMAEQYLPGPQISTETLIDSNEAFTIGFSDRNYEALHETKPYFIENGGDAPSVLSESSQQAVIAAVEKAAKALGISHGVAKGDMVLTDEGPKVIEIAGRLSGGYFSTTQIPLATGVNFVEQAIKLCLGQKLDPTKLSCETIQGVAIRYLPVQQGTIRQIRGLEKADSAQGLKVLKLFVKEGDKIGSIENHTQRAGFAICTGATKAEAIQRTNKALSMIEIEYV